MKKTEKLGHPINAEEYNYEDFIQRVNIKKKSKIVKGLFSTERKEFFICPKCKNANDVLLEEPVYECDDCGISVQRIGHTLYLWE